MRVILAVLVILGAQGCPSPCSQCPNVAGNFNMVIPSNATPGCNYEITGGGVIPIQVTQSGNQVTASFLGQAMIGTLLSNNYITFNTIPGPETSDDRSTTLTFEGTFNPSNGDFTGTVLIEVFEKCQINDPVTWS